MIKKMGDIGRFLSLLLASCLLSLIVLSVSVVCITDRVDAAPVVQSADRTNLSAAELEQAVSPLVSEQIRTLKIPGAAVVITQGEDIIFSQGYGYANVEQQIWMDPQDTKVHIGSLTKTITATAAMQLVEQGEIETDADVNDYLTSYQLGTFNQQPITLHHLLTHTAGLDQVLYGTVAASQDELVGAESFLQQYVKNQPPVREPGTRYEYSNAGLGLVGNLIEQVRGQSLDEYMKEHLFQPLGMSTAALDMPDESPDLPLSYDVDKEGTYHPVSYQHFNIPGAGGLSVTPNEFAHFMIAQLNEGMYKGNALLKPETVYTMQHEQYTDHPELDGVGYGFFLGKLSNALPMVYHTGEVEGFISKMVLIPSRQIGIYVVVNAGQSDVQLHNQVVESITDLLGPVNTDTSQVIITPQSAEQMQNYEGHYMLQLSPQHGWGRWVKFFEKGGYTIRADGYNLIVSGTFPEEEEEQHKRFVPIQEGVFQEEGAGRFIWFHEQDGQWKATGLNGVTMSQTSWWDTSLFLLAVCACFILFWIFIAITWLIRYIIRWFSSNRRPVSRMIGVMAVIYGIAVPLQIVYGLTYMSTGFPFWYQWGLCSLPWIAALLGGILLLQNVRGTVKGKGVSIGRGALAVIALAFTAYMGYWNMLSIHFY
ncbi:serine hydrolase domain-containing protein [Paenibacillus sp. 11B]|uniref:serine hydrolase domain-containing protein n=1 Tax=Paenibacillus sp. 11B TaxID=3060965 RepID=UPI0026544803|nr:serine hydrolase domain-containing protein [Paenibacillus sp. 11B]MDN8588498.1 serine hydrolase domain-containing protein [Paenibacillus sp. 11B]